jgi:general secretion pathway protein D
VLLFGGYALLPVGDGAHKVVPTPDALPGAALVTDSLRNDDRVVATLLSLQWTEAESIAAKLQHLVSRQDIIEPFARTNSLILVGRESRLARLIGLAKLLDQERGKSDVWIRAIRYRDASDVASLVQSALERPGMGTDAEIQGDQRTNRLVVKANPEDMAFIQDLVERVDQPRATTGDIEVLPLLFRNAEELVSMLQNLGSGPRIAAPIGGGAGRPDQATQAIIDSALAGREFALAADTRTRSLLVQADPETRELIREVVEQIDLPPRQIFLEFAIVEFDKPHSVSLSFDFFLPLTNPKSIMDPVAFIFSNPSGGGLRADKGDELDYFARVGREPLVLSATDPGTGESVQIVVPREQAVAGGRDRSVTARLKSRPSLLVIAGEEQTLSVGNNIPIPVSQNDGGLSSQLLAVSQQIERYDTGVKVRVKPTIGEAGRIRLELDIRVDQVIPSPDVDVNRVGPVLAQREVQATVLLRPGEIGILGMAQEQTQGESVNKVPFFGDIPFLGWFFRASSWELRDRQVLMTVQAREVDSLTELEAESIRQRMKFERSLVRQNPLSTSEDEPFTIRVASLTTEREAEGLESRLNSRGFAAYQARWSWEGHTYYDVYVGTYTAVLDLIAEARKLDEAGFRSELVVDTDGYGPDLPRTGVSPAPIDSIVEEEPKPARTTRTRFQRGRESAAGVTLRQRASS